MRYIKGLDTIRAVAICLVIFWHWYPQYPIFSFLGIIQHIFIPTGETGVTLFFVLSGFLITSILLKAKSENDNKLVTIKNFIIRRSLRIFPIYYLLIALLFLAGFPFGQGHLPYYLTYTANFLVIREGHWNNFSHTWSLSVEEQFYLLWPWLILYIKDVHLKYIFYSAILIAIITMVASIGVLHIKMPYAFTPCCFDAFGVGGFYAYCQLNENRYAEFKQKLKIALPIVLAIYFIWKLCPYFDVSPKLIFFQRTIDSIISIWLIDFVINTKPGWFKNSILENKTLNTIGKISYGLYLYHYIYPYFFNQFIQYSIEKIPSLNFLTNTYVNQILALSSLFLIAYLSFELFEKRITELKSRFECKGNRKILVD